MSNFAGRARGWASRALGHTKLNQLVTGERRDARDARYAALAQLARRVAPGYLDPLAASEARVFSQNGEDGVLGELFRRVGVGRRSFVEFGIQEGREGNAVLLADVGGWEGLFIEPDPEAFEALSRKYAHHPRVKTRSDRVRPDNLDDILRASGLFEELDLLSIDVDGADYWIWRSSRARPRVVVIEFNASLGLERRVAPLESAGWDGTAAFGASLSALHALGRAKGYTLVYVELAGVNAFFVRDDLLAEGGLPARTPSEVYRSPNFGLEGRAHPPGPPIAWVTVCEDGEPTSSA